MGLEDLPYVVSAHRTHFPYGFFARLGPRFLTRYYRTFLDSARATAIIAEVDGTVRGYLSGVLSTRRHRQLLLQHHGRSLALSGLWGLLTHPGLAVTFILTRIRRYFFVLLRAHHEADGPSVSADDKVAVLSHVAVSSGAQGAGIGRALVEQFLHEARTAGCTRAVLVTLAGADGAGAYYEHCGWQRIAERLTVDGLDLAEYQLILDDDPTTRPRTP